MSAQSPTTARATQGAAASGAVTYQLFIHLRRACRIAPGRLGEHRLPPGWYVYTGSARRALAARVRRHLSSGHPRRWHIDWLLERPEARVAWVAVHGAGECRVNRAVGGAVPVRRFGASDCRSGCGSHLRYLGDQRPGAVPADAATRRRALAAWRRGRWPAD